MPLKNYKSKIPAKQSVHEIQDMLQKHGADGILLNYEKGTGRIESLVFKIDVAGRPTGFKLPIKWREAQAFMLAQHVSKAKDDDFCYRIAWRLIRNWLEQQIALIALDMVDLHEIFLPYMIQKNGQTLYEFILENPHKLLE